MARSRFDFIAQTSLGGRTQWARTHVECRLFRPLTDAAVRAEPVTSGSQPGPCAPVDRCSKKPVKTIISRPGSKLGNTRQSKAVLPKMPASSMLVLGGETPHQDEGDRHGRPSYVLVL